MHTRKEESQARESGKFSPLSEPFHFSEKSVQARSCGCGGEYGADEKRLHLEQRGVACIHPMHHPHPRSSTE